MSIAGVKNLDGIDGTDIFGKLSEAFYLGEPSLPALSKLLL